MYVPSPAILSSFAFDFGLGGTGGGGGEPGLLLGRNSADPELIEVVEEVLDTGACDEATVAVAGFLQIIRNYT